MSLSNLIGNRKFLLITFSKRIQLNFVHICDVILCVATAVTLTAVFCTTNWTFSHTSMAYICRVVYLYKHLLYFISENCNFPSPFRLPMRIEYAFDVERSSEAHTSRISNKIHDHIISGNRRYLLAILAKQRTTLAAAMKHHPKGTHCDTLNHHQQLFHMRQL